MKRMRILLALSGSRNSERAAEVSWHMARLGGHSLDAWHIVDTRTARKWLHGNDPGLIGSGLYNDAYESVHSSLRLLAEKLGEKYQAVAAGRHVTTRYFIHEGAPVEEICRLTADYDLLVLGRGTTTYCAGDMAGDLVHSLPAQLADRCQIPLLLVSDHHESCQALKVLACADDLAEGWIQNCLSFAKYTGTEPELILVHGENEQPDLKALKRQFVGRLHQLRRVALKESSLSSPTGDSPAPLWQPGENRVSIDGNYRDLVVVPTRKADNGRMTLFGTAAGEFVRTFRLPHLLLWPCEFRRNADNKGDPASLLSRMKEKNSAGTSLSECG